MRISPAFCLMAILALPVGGLAPAQSSPASQNPSVRVTSRAVVVDVVVAKGDEPIVGLKKQDFEILENGKPQSIDFFEEHTARTLPAGSVPPLPALPPGVYTNVPPAPESDSVNVLLLDSLNTDQEDQIYVHNQIIGFLKSMQPGTRTAIFTLSSKLRMIQGFTEDTAALRAALNDPRYGFTPASADSSRSSQDKKDDLYELETMSMMKDSAASIESVHSFQQDLASVQGGKRVAMTLEALQYLGRYLAGVPGRKNLIWFSTSFPVSVFPRIGQSQHPNQMNTLDLRDYGKEVRETADLLTTSKIAVYPIGAEGVMSEHVFEANADSGPQAGPQDYEGGEAGTGRNTVNVGAYVHEGDARADKIMTMEQLASDTGGKAFFNTNDLNAATQKAIADGAHYYTIAYTPTNKKMDGSYRRVEVKVPNGKYRLAYRHGYNADDEEKFQSSRNESNPLHALMTHGLPAATQIMYAARVVPANPQPAANATRAGKNAKLTGPTRRYVVDLFIRWTDVKLDAQPDGSHSGKLQLELLAWDRAGNAVNWAGGTQMMNLDPTIYAAIRKSGVPGHFEIDLPSDKDIYLETGVYDFETGKAGTLEIPLPMNQPVTDQASNAVKVNADGK
ncbi:MAG TPA: VWA domain-containing protein [Terracidiphilus sp.]|nr:VWA domain-containing protein [Terracidiphilus sp.]